MAGKAVCDDGIVIDLSGMKGIRVDPMKRVAHAQPAYRGESSTARRRRSGSRRWAAPSRRAEGRDLHPACFEGIDLPWANLTPPIGCVETV
ncbi:MAG: hypothetical protein WD670_08110 [Actinomycetota bacterium]